jgi:uncharacterized membrane protein YbaN (DUF454 family)
MDTETPDLLPELLRCERADHALAWRALWIVGAVLCFVAGVVGWLVPVITGIPFYIAGLVLLAKAVPAVGHKVNAWERRLPLKWRLVLRPKYRRWRKELALAEDAARKQEEAGAAPPAAGEVPPEGGREGPPESDALRPEGGGAPSPDERAG